MNVYSVQFIPQLKLKFCEILGIASAYAINELCERLIRIDQKMDRFEGQIRKIHRQQMVLESAQTRLEEGEKKKRSQAKAQTKEVIVSERGIKKNIVTPDNVTPIPVRAAARKKLPTVLMIQSDVKTQGVVRDYFGKSAKVLSVDTVTEIPEGIEKDKLVSIFFERNLLSNEQARAILEELQAAMPKTRFVGVSNYLTLALAQAAEVQEDFATFMTQPVTAEDLSAIFSPEEQVEQTQP
jgi:hypothetical protein